MISERRASVRPSQCILSLVFEERFSAFVKKEHRNEAALKKESHSRAEQRENPNLCKDLPVSDDGPPSPTRWWKLFWTHVYWPHCWIERRHKRIGPCSRSQPVMGLLCCENSLSKERQSSQFYMVGKKGCKSNWLLFVSMMSLLQPFCLPWRIGNFCHLLLRIFSQQSSPITGLLWLYGHISFAVVQ